MKTFLNLAALVLFSIILLSSIFGQNTVNKTETEKWREDLRFMAQEMPKTHKNLFHTITREQFESAVKNLDERIPSLARHQIIVEMAKIVAMIGDGYTNIAPTRDPIIAFRVLPIKLYFFKDGLYIRAAKQEHADLVGAKVIKIDNLSVDEAYKRVGEIISRDNEMGVKFFAPSLLVMPEILHALGIIENLEEAKLTIDLNGKIQVVSFKSFVETDLMPPDTDLSWKRKTNWVDMREAARAPSPLWLKNDPNDKFWFEYLADSRLVYVQIN
jgi:hypothetical protein